MVVVVIAASEQAYHLHNTTPDTAVVVVVVVVVVIISLNNKESERILFMLDWSAALMWPVGIAPRSKVYTYILKEYRIVPNIYQQHNYYSAPAYTLTYIFPENLRENFFCLDIRRQN